jgi:hypothetical protein
MLRTDNFAPTKKPTCQHGDPCGGSCIDPREACRVELSPQMQAQVQGLKNSLLNAVPGGRELNTARAVISDFKRVREAGTLGQQAAYFGAVLLGASAIGYAKYREKYRAGFDNSAEVAMRRAKGMVNSIPDIGGKQNIIFAVDSSLSKGDKGRGNGLATELAQDPDFAAKYHIVSVKQNAHETPKALEGLNKRDRLLAEAMTPIKQALMNARNGQSDASVELASQVLAYNEKYGKVIENYQERVWDGSKYVYQTKQRTLPSKVQINLLGHGDGGMVASEAMEILKKTPGADDLHKSINVIGLNTPDAGLTDTVGKVRTIASRNSPLSLLPMKGKITMDAPDGEGGRMMVRKKEVRQFIDGHFGGNPVDIPKAPATQATQTKPPATQATHAKAPEVRTVQWSNPSSLNERPAVVKTTNLGAQTSLSLTPATTPATTLKSSVARQILSSSGPDELVDHQKVLKQYPTLSNAEAYQVSSLGGLPTRLRNEYIEGRVGLPAALEIAREIAYDDIQKKAYMKALTALRSQKPDASIDPADYLKALKRLRGDSLWFRLDALKLRVA